ncbi:MAG: ankyrin repeat domain-containing protein [Spirochaetaceae bacterium]|jgi:ankyrin repeat protein|nr:ankyrin repeat domain-containing protein [Spirochaetaceae bacterium]
MKRQMQQPGLIEAVLNDDKEKVQNLLASGVDINITDRAGWTALHFTAQENNIVLAKILLENEARVDIQEEHGNTPLFKAVFNCTGDGTMIKLLLSYGADRNLKNNYGVSPLDLANTIDNYSVAQFLQ